MSQQSCVSESSRARAISDEAPIDRMGSIDNFVGFINELIGKDGMHRCSKTKRSDPPEMVAWRCNGKGLRISMDDSNQQNVAKTTSSDEGILLITLQATKQ